MNIKKNLKGTIIVGTLISSVLISNVAEASTYTVKSGDNLSVIGYEHNVPVSTIKDLNSLTSNLIYPGMELKLDNKSQTSTYTVKPGDYLSKIASKYNTTTQKLLSLNPEIKNPSIIHVGDEIRVSGSSSTPISSTNNSTGTHIVKSGEYLSLIAQNYDISYASLLNANPDISNPSIIQVGQHIEIPSGASSVSTTTSTVEKAENKNVDALIEDVIDEGEKYLGADYLFGASTSRTDAFDCSSFTLKAFKAAGVDLPRVSRYQAKEGDYVSRSNLQRGDLIFFDTNRNGVINHVGIYLGNNKMINSQSSKGVAIADLQYYWSDKYVTARRVLN